MGRIQYIETSQKWICPETGSYKVICVGGGGGGYNLGEGINGGTTSFGTYLSARGGGVITSEGVNAAGMGGSGGYTVNGVYGGSGALVNDGSNSSHSAVNNGGNSGQTGIGYGAGGGSITNSCGKQGELKVDILTLTKDDAVACTVGTGGKSDSNGTAGNDGVIIIEFLSAEA